MPYKDAKRKTDWERLHRPQRLARRRELRRTEAAREEAQPAPPMVEERPATFLWLPLVAGGALAAYSPKLAIGAGGLTLLVAAHYKKDWSWWIVGSAYVGLWPFFLLERREQKQMTLFHWPSCFPSRLGKHARGFRKHSGRSAPAASQ
jgi:hypothetical protein